MLLYRIIMVSDGDRWIRPAISFHAEFRSKMNLNCIHSLLWISQHHSLNKIDQKYITRNTLSLDQWWFIRHKLRTSCSHNNTSKILIPLSSLICYLLVLNSYLTNASYLIPNFNMSITLHLCIACPPSSTNSVIRHPGPTACPQGSRYVCVSLRWTHLLRFVLVWNTVAQSPRENRFVQEHCQWQKLLMM